MGQVEGRAGLAEDVTEVPDLGLHQENVPVYLSVPCAHILIKHKSTDLEHVTTKRHPVNNRVQTTMNEDTNWAKKGKSKKFQQVLLWQEAVISQHRGKEPEACWETCQKQKQDKRKPRQ